MTEFEGDNIVSSSVADYLDRLVGDVPGTALEMQQEAREREFPIVGPQVGRLLELLVSVIRPSTIYELGSGFGYSAFWFAQGLDSGEIHLTDHETANLNSAREYLDSTQDDITFQYHHGDALDLLESFDGNVDLLFVDIDKDEYPAALDQAEKRLDHGQWIIADNVLWKGRVADSAEADRFTEGVREFNQRLSNGPWATSILPIRDGLALARRTDDAGSR